MPLLDTCLLVACAAGSLLCALATHGPWHRHARHLLMPAAMVVLMGAVGSGGMRGDTPASMGAMATPPRTPLLIALTLLVTGTLLALMHARGPGQGPLVRRLALLDAADCAAMVGVALTLPEHAAAGPVSVHHVPLGVVLPVLLLAVYGVGRVAGTVLALVIPADAIGSVTRGGGARGFALAGGVLTVAATVGMALV